MLIMPKTMRSIELFGAEVVSALVQPGVGRSIARLRRPPRATVQPRRRRDELRASGNRAPPC